MLSFPSSSVEQPSLADWLVGTLQESGPRTLDELGQRLPDTNWAQLLLAVDYLSRNGHASMSLLPQGDYLVSLSRAGGPSESALSRASTELVSTTTL